MIQCKLFSSIFANNMKYIATNVKITTKYILYLRPISNHHLSYEERYNVTEFVLKHMHISIKNEQSLLNINSFHVHLENSKYKIL